MIRPSKALDGLARRLELGPERAEPARLEEVERRVLALGVRLGVVAVFVQSVGHVANRVAFDREYEIIDADLDTGVFTWASSAATLACGVAVLLLALLWSSRQRLLAALSAALSYLALDDMYAIHDRIAVRLERRLPSGDGTLFGIEEPGRLIWPLVFLPLFAFTFLGLWAIATRLRPQPARLARLGLIGLAVAVGMEMVALAIANLGFDSDGFVYQSEVTLEEGIELLAFTVLATALIAGLLNEAARRIRV